MVVTRFAPSPTGYLHVGSARTALFCWLWAKRTSGKFILRIEDTDLVRSTQEAIDVIIEGLNWLGLNWDEGPYYQTKRFDRYKAVLDQLIKEGHAYQCYCTKERLAELKETQIQSKQKPRYDGHCRSLSQESQKSKDKSEPYVVRFKTPLTGEIVVSDIIKGKVTFQNEELDDLILLRSDGSPTYNFTVVVDDWDMGVTHVLRGDDHLNNTPRQIHILRALGASIPEYGHMPMILGGDGKKLSKRHGAASVLDFRDAGYLPEALLNYLVRLGWSHGDQEIFTIEQLKQYFDIHELQAAPAAINTEKLLWLNHHYIKTLPVSDVARRLEGYLVQLGCSVEKGPALEKVVEAQKERCKTLLEMAQRSQFLYGDVVSFDEKAQEQHIQQAALNPLKTFVEKLSVLTDWETQAIHDALSEVVSELGIKLGQLAQPIRVAVTGGTTSPSIDVTLNLLGKELTLKRLNDAIKKIESDLS